RVADADDVVAQFVGQAQFLAKGLDTLAPQVAYPEFHAGLLCDPVILCSTLFGRRYFPGNPRRRQPACLGPLARPRVFMPGLRGPGLHSPSVVVMLAPSALGV